MKPKDEIQRLIENYADGRLSGAEAADLKEILRADPAARHRLRRWLNLDAGLRDLAEGADRLAASGGEAWKNTPGAPGTPGPAETPPDGTVAALPPSSPRWIPLSAAALFLLMAAVLGGLFWHQQGKPATTAAAGASPSGREETMMQGFAVLTRVIDGEWEADAGGRTPKAGEVLAAGRLRLKSGLAQVEFFSGATVILQGKTELEILSMAEARCHGGKIRARVPPAARGFVLRTPGGDIVDLGTDFAVEVSGARSSVHVFDGEVEVRQEQTPARTLTTGEGFDLATRLPTTRAAAPGSFVSVADLDDQSHASRGLRFEKWRAHSGQLRGDPRLLAYYTFDQPGQWNRTLKNVATAAATTADGGGRDAAIVGARKVPGRWPGHKSALEFKPTGSRARVFIPGEFASLSFACWARIDSLDRQYNALFLADNAQRGEPHWQIQSDGRLMLFLYVKPGKSPMYLSPVIWDIGMSGRWLHLASVFDEAAQSVTHYVNGKAVSTEAVPPHAAIHTTRIGAGEIGNWGLPNRPDEPWFAVRNLNGAIDEFAIFSAALGAEEIRRMYESGKPH